MTVTLLLLFFVLLVYYCYAHYGRKGRFINLLPGPTGIPIFGNSFLLYNARNTLWNILHILCNDYYPILKLWIFCYPVVSIRHPDDLEVILSSIKHIEKTSLYNILHPWFGTGLLTSGGVKWHLRRKILTPAFHFNILQQFVDILIEEGNQMTKILKNAGGTVVKDLIPFLSEHTLNAICETAMGTSLQDFDTLQQQYRKAVYDMGELFIYRLTRQWFYLSFIFALSPQGRKQKKVLKILHEFTEKIIAERKLYHELTHDRYLQNLENNEVAEIDDARIGVRKKRLAMLPLLIAASRKGLLTDLDIREEVDTFMFEGHDTTAVALCFALSLLAEHKDIQDRVRTEVDTIIRENGGKLTMKSLNNLPYLDRCLKEALRLYPSVYFIARHTTQDVKLRSYMIPTGTFVHLNIYAVHRDPNFWPNPDVFDPDRFLPENIKNRHLYSYIPFSAGPRNCIGQKYALLEMKAIVAPLVHNFFLEPIDYLKDLEIVVDLVIRSAHPMRIKFVPVDSVQTFKANTDFQSVNN